MSSALAIRSFSRISATFFKTNVYNQHNLRFSSTSRISQTGSKFFSSAASPSPQQEQSPQQITLSSPTGQTDKVYDPKLVKIVNDIARLTLLEVAELNECLKKTLNIPDTPMMMPMMGGGAGQLAGGAGQEEEEAAPAKVQTSFTLKLIKFDEGKKVPLIKEIKALVEGMNLVQAKKFVESAPTIVKADIGKEEAEKLLAALTAVGATCEIS